MAVTNEEAAAAVGGLQNAAQRSVDTFAAWYRVIESGDRNDDLCRQHIAAMADLSMAVAKMFDLLNQFRNEGAKPG